MLVDAVLPGRERARDGLRRRARRGRVRRPERRPLRRARSTRASGRFVAMSLAGTIGYTLGSVVGWAIGLLRRAAVPRAPRPLAAPRARERLERAERWFERWGDAAVFLGRLTPVVRSFVSIPAGVFRMPLGRYTVLTFARLAHLVLRVRRRRLGARARLGELPPRRSATWTTPSPRAARRRLRSGWSSVGRRVDVNWPPCRRSRSLTSRRSTRRCSTS